MSNMGAGPYNSLRYKLDMDIEADPGVPERLWYFSFVNRDSPEGDLFLGGLFLQAKSFSGAIKKSHEAKINPGGEALGGPVPPEIPVDPKWVGRLLSKEDLDKFDEEHTAKAG
jgi:hypothetical protein